ncbi:MAG TPA: hypothetical protein VKI43_08085 [Vicinamibacterales bacterium]|nr:hypothetical protein [Vicinamibacterales bacterium]
MNLLAWLAAGAVIVTASAPAQQPALPAPATQATATPVARVFGSNTGLVLNFIKADKTADFEAVMAKLKDALDKSENPVRKQQAASWRVFKSPDAAAGGAALYVYIVDPAVKGADYSVTAILSEAFSADELAALFKQYTESYATGQNYVNLTLLSELGK